MKKPFDVIPVERITHSIHVLRGQKVMLDSNLAELYGIDTRTLNQAVKRNLARFPKDFMFSLTREEILRISQIVTSSATLKFSKRVHVFTEQGVAMLSSVLHSDRAVRVNIAIMRAFIKLREALGTNRDLARKFAELEARVGDHDEQIAEIIEAISQLIAPASNEPKKEMGFHIRETSPRYRVRKS